MIKVNNNKPIINGKIPRKSPFFMAKTAIKFPIKSIRNGSINNGKKRMHIRENEIKFVCGVHILLPINHICLLGLTGDLTISRSLALFGKTEFS
tara:strand:+ start:289 stop:570 length:282 start_codon:yes stop_codon:yes gene_type:complete